MTPSSRARYFQREQIALGHQVMITRKEFLSLALRWVYFYNVLRPHLGKGMEKRNPFEVLKDLGYNGPESIALFPPLILDYVSTDLLQLP
jgi:hypothetical protein